MWKGSYFGIYTISSGYLWLLKRQVTDNREDSWLWLWRLKFPEKWKFLIRLALHNSLPTNTLQATHGLGVSTSCVRCDDRDDLMSESFIASGIVNAQPVSGVL